MRSCFALVLLGLTATASADAKDDALADVGKKLSVAYSRRDPPSPYNDKNLAPIRDAAAACLATIDRALSAGATLDSDVAVPTKVPGSHQVQNPNKTWSTMAPLREAQALCTSYAAKPQALKVEYALYLADTSMKKAEPVRKRAEAKPGLDNDARNEAEAMEKQVEPCRAAVDAALAAGVTSDHEVQLRTLGKVSIGDAKAKVCDALAAASKAIMEIEVKKLEKKLAPYRAALKGEKITTFVDRYMIFDTIYGKDQSQLDTPAKLAGASAWYILLDGDVGLGFKSITVRRYLWNGNKLGSVKEVTGCCF